MTKAELLNPLVLAWVGDAVCHEYVRIRLVSESDAKVHALERLSTRYVSAKAQAAVYDRLLPNLAEAEADVARRGLNAKAGHTAKNATDLEYRKSSAIEAVIGWLKLSDQNVRLTELLNTMFEICNEG